MRPWGEFRDKVHRVDKKAAVKITKLDDYKITM